jgi:hypothetical protein
VEALPRLPPGSSIDPSAAAHHLSRSISGLPTVNEERDRNAGQQVRVLVVMYWSFIAMIISHKRIL